MVFGLVQKKLALSGWKEGVLGVVCIVASFAVGMACPLIFAKTTWSYITFVYIFFAAVLPMWLLKQPRDHMTTFMFVAMIVGAVLGLIVNHPVMNLPVFTGFTNAKLGTMFPILFVTVACGAVSGFHSLVSSGTSSKTVTNEKDMLKVGYGAMVLESLLAVIALCVAGASAAADGTPADGTPFQIFSRGVASFFVGFGLDQHLASVFMTMCVSALALTSLDAVARIGRMSFQELFSVDDMEHAEGWRKLLCNVYFSTFLTLAFGFLLTKIGYANIWPLFGSANQLLSALVLITLLSLSLTRSIRRLTQKVRKTSSKGLLLSDPAALEALNSTVTSPRDKEIYALEIAYIQMMAKLRENAVNELALREGALQAQLSALQTQINPHFIYNTLNIISAKSMESGNLEIIEICSQFASMLRYSTDTRSRTATLEEEIENVRDYLMLAKARYEDNLEYVIDVPRSLYGIEIPKLTLQPLVENALNHGFDGKNILRKLSIIGTLTQKELILTIQDNGNGFSADMLHSLRQRIDEIEHGLVSIEKSGGHIGLVNTCLRLYYYSKGTMHMSIHNDGGAIITLTMPIQ